MSNCTCDACLARTTAIPPALSDEQIIEIRKATRCHDPRKQWGDTLMFARAIERAILAASLPRETAPDPLQAMVDDAQRLGLYDDVYPTERAGEAVQRPVHDSERISASLALGVFPQKCSDEDVMRWRERMPGAEVDALAMETIYRDREEVGITELLQAREFARRLRIGTAND